jgi:hypothetical protein
VASQPSDPNIGNTNFPPETGAPVEKVKRSKFWVGCLIGCSGLVLGAIVLIIVLALYVKEHKNEFIAKGSNLIKTIIIDAAEEDVPQEKKDHLLSLIDRVSDKLGSSESGDESVTLLQDIQSFGDKLSKHMRDEKLSEPEIDDLIKALESVMPVAPEAD